MESRPTQHLDKPPALSTLNSSNAIHGGVNDPPILRRRIIACLDGTWDTPSGKELTVLCIGWGIIMSCMHP